MEIEWKVSWCVWYLLDVLVQRVRVLVQLYAGLLRGLRTQTRMQVAHLGT